VVAPLRRTGRNGSGAFEPIKRDAALDEIVARWQDVIAEHGKLRPMVRDEVRAYVVLVPGQRPDEEATAGTRSGPLFRERGRRFSAGPPQANALFLCFQRADRSAARRPTPTDF
jgi:anaerobic selenocysteine-containing dehydrogenase